MAAKAAVAETGKRAVAGVVAGTSGGNVAGAEGGNVATTKVSRVGGNSAGPAEAAATLAASAVVPRWQKWQPTLEQCWLPVLPLFRGCLVGMCGLCTIISCFSQEICSESS